jgi:Flp pilus assembly protein, protease CpaA
VAFTAPVLEGFVLLAALSLFALVTAYDVTFRIIPNHICLAILAVGVVRHLCDGQAVYLLVSVGVASVLFLLLSLLCAAGLLGGGDVKLMASAIVLLGAGKSFVFLYYTLLAGGILSLVYLSVGMILRARHRHSHPQDSHSSGPHSNSSGRPSVDPLRLRVVWRAECRRLRRGGPLPYGVAIAVGALAALGLQPM